MPESDERLCRRVGRDRGKVPLRYTLFTLGLLISAVGCGEAQSTNSSSKANAVTSEMPGVSQDWDRLWSSLIETQRAVWDSKLDRSGDMERAKQRLANLQRVLDTYPERGDGLDYVTQDFIAISHDYLSNIAEATDQIRSMVGKPKDQAMQQLQPKLAALAEEKNDIVARYNKWQGKLVAVIQSVKKTD